MAGAGVRMSRDEIEVLTTGKLISIICPVYNEQDAIPMFYQRLQRALLPLRSRYDFELIFTNNRSTDRTLEILSELSRQDRTIQVITFSRNFGYQASLLAGMKHALGDALVVIDVDCEDPPELIVRFVAGWENGYDIVYGQRGNRPEGWFLLGMRRLFYRLNRAVADNEIVLDMAEFSLIAAHVRDVIVDNNSTFPFLRTDIGFAGFKRLGIAYDRQTRVAGRTNYNFWRMTAFAIGGILSSSTFVLRLAAYLAPLVFVSNLLLAIIDLVYDSPRAFRLLATIDLLSLVTFGAAVCIYQARIYKDGVDRPVFVVDWQLSDLSPRRMWTTHRTLRFEVGPEPRPSRPSEVPKFFPSLETEYRDNA
jgi:dolichol-phosphate mannosyltransferase